MKKDMVISDWENYLDIDVTNRNIKEEFAEWLDEDGSLVLICDGHDFRDAFLRSWRGLFNEEFNKLYF